MHKFSIDYSETARYNGINRKGLQPYRQGDEDMEETGHIKALEKLCCENDEEIIAALLDFARLLAGDKGLSY